jgi:exosortase/archaeosortase
MKFWERSPQQKAATTRKWIRVEVTVLFILIVELCLYVIEWAMNQMRGKLNPHLHILILMISLVLLFYFAIKHIESVANWIIKKTTQAGTEQFGRRAGVSLVFIGLLIIIYVAFYFFTFGKLPIITMK